MSRPGLTMAAGREGKAMAFFRSRRRPPAPLYAAMGVVVILGFAFATWQVWRNDNALRDRGREAPAEVVAISRGKSTRVVVAFTTAEGRRVESQIGQGDSVDGTRVGDQLTVVYDPEKPTDDVRDVRVPENHRTAYLTLGITILAAVGVPLATWGIVRADRRDRAARRRG